MILLIILQEKKKKNQQNLLKMNWSVLKETMMQRVYQIIIRHIMIQGFHPSIKFLEIMKYI